MSIQACVNTGFAASDTEVLTREYAFDDFIPVHICDGFQIRISDLV